MRYKTHVLSAFFCLVLLAVLFTGHASGQSTYGASAITYNSSNNQVASYTWTELDYDTSVYYFAVADANITQFGSDGSTSVVATGWAEDSEIWTGSSWVMGTTAELDLTYSGSSGDSYQVESAHALITGWLYYDESCESYTEYDDDEFGYSDLPGSTVIPELTGVYYDPGMSAQYSATSNTWTAPGTPEPLGYTEIIIGNTSAMADETPGISSVSPSSVYQGQTVVLSVKGGGFGNNPQLNISGSGFTIQTPYLKATDSEIDASVTIDASTTVGDYDVTVTSQGFNGNGFTSNGTGGSATSPSSTLTVAAAAIYIDLINPYGLLSSLSGTGTTIPQSDVLSSASSDISTGIPTYGAAGLIADGASTAIAIVQVPTAADVTISVDQGGTVAAYDEGFLTSVPSTSSSSQTVTPVAYGSSYYAVALVQAPDATNTGFTATKMTITYSIFGSTSSTATLGLFYPYVLYVHGIWGDTSSLSFLANDLNARYSNGVAGLAVCYSSLVPWYATSGPSGSGCDMTTQDAIDGGYQAVLSNYYSHSIVGGRVDIVAHSMGGLASLNYASLSGYYTEPHSRGLGAIHTLVTIDTPAAGSDLATYLVNNYNKDADPGLPPFASFIWGANCYVVGDDLESCLRKNNMPLMAPGASITSGAAYSLEPSVVASHLTSTPQKPTHSNWHIIYGSYSDTASPRSLLRVVLQQFVTALCPLGGCSGGGPPTLTGILGNNPNDVIVTVNSQEAGVSDTKWTPPSANLEHTSVGGFLAYISSIIPRVTDDNVLQSTAVDDQVYQYVHPTH